jgi:hypothetical protein
VADGSIKAFGCGLLAALLLITHLPSAGAGQPGGRGVLSLSGISTHSQRKSVIDELPLDRLTATARQRILAVTESPTLYRRLPTQTIECDQDMFLFISRNPEVLVGMWDLMGITNVQLQRTGPYQLETADGSGTKCTVDLVYGDSNLHIYFADGSYDGRLVTSPIHGSGVFVLRSQYGKNPAGEVAVKGTLDCFVQFDSLGADLIARTLSGIIGRSADHNYVETARFIGQVSQATKKNPPAMIDIARRMPQVSEPTKDRFIDVIATSARRAGARKAAAVQQIVKPVSRRD